MRDEGSGFRVQDSGPRHPSLAPSPQPLVPRPSYQRVFATFARNSLVRDMTFRTNFLLDTISSIGWVTMNLAFYLLIFQYTGSIGANTGWEKWEFFVYMGTFLLINSTVQMLFMVNADEFSELIRTGGLDFALLKPIDTQFLVSLQRIDWSSGGNFVFGLVLLVYSLFQLEYVPGAIEVLLYLVYLACGVVILYSLMIAMAATSIWLGRNQNLLDFWFYLTTFNRNPMEIYSGRFGTPLRWFLTFIIPILVVVNVPARFLVRTLTPQSAADWLLPAFALAAAVASLLASRWVFNRALGSYRSASS